MAVGSGLHTAFGPFVALLGEDGSDEADDQLAEGGSADLIVRLYEDQRVQTRDLKPEVPF